jgi:transcriptional regulator GlxA family with amidase domain
MRATDCSINAANEDIAAAIPSLIDAAVAAFDADRDSSRRYLLRASALLGVKRRARAAAESAPRSKSRGGLLAWQLNRVVDYIERHLADKITAMDLAGLINVSMGQLFRAFKISVGVTPCHYIARRRVELACTLMSTTAEPLCEVAAACGLCDQAHLCRIFRRMTGMSPSAWRRAIPARDTATSRIIAVSPGADQRRPAPMESLESNGVLRRWGNSVVNDIGDTHDQS